MEDIESVERWVGASFAQGGLSMLVCLQPHVLVPPHIPPL